MSILPQLLINSLIAGSLYALASIGLSLTYGVVRILNFAHGHLMMLGAYLFLLFAIEMNYGAPLGLLCALISIGIIAMGCYKVFAAPFLNYNPMLVFVSTLSLATILESLVSIFFGVNVKSLSSETFESLELWGVYITPIQILIICVAIIVPSSMAYLIHRTALGRQIRATSQNSIAAQSLGLSTEKLGLFIFTVSALLSALAGILVGYETNLQPTMGGSYTIKAFAAMILGGLGNIWGTILGSFALGLIENLSIGIDFGDYSLPAGYKDAFSFMAILLVLLVRPQGLFGKSLRKV